MKALTPLFISMLVLAGCGGGGGSSNRAPAPVATAPEPGSISVVVGDAALDGIDAVIIDIEEVLLLGDDGQISLTDGPINDVNLLDQRLASAIGSEEHDCDEYCSSTGCSWTLDWACPGHGASGFRGTAGADSSIGFRCCCEQKWCPFDASDSRVGDFALVRIADGSRGRFVK